MPSHRSALARAAQSAACIVSVALLALGVANVGCVTAAPRPDTDGSEAPRSAVPRLHRPPVPIPAKRPDPAQPERLKRINAVRSWGYQLHKLNIEDAARTPFDLLIVDATTGLAAGRHFLPSEVERLRSKPDGSRRLVISYLSIGEAEDYRPDYFSDEYMTEDAPDWLMHENPQWKGNRIIRFCHEGWQRTILGDETGRSVYNSIDPSPLYRLIELGFDGIYLDRVDVYSEIPKECPGAEAKMVDFVARLAAHARLRNPNFMVILQNAEELVQHPRMMSAIDALAKEDLFYGADHSQNLNSAGEIRGSLEHLKAVKAAGRPVFVIDYVTGEAKKADAKRRILEQGFVPYLGPRDLGRLWLPGKDF